MFFLLGDQKLTQSNAILRYIARKNDLCGKTDAEKARVDLMAEQSMDFRNGIVRISYNPNFEQLLPEYLVGLDKKLDEFSRFLADFPWFAGNNISFVDFIMYELLDQHRILAPEAVAKFGKLVDFLNRFEKLPQIEAYMKSDRFLKAPINNKMAKFGNK